MAAALSAPPLSVSAGEDHKSDFRQVFTLNPYKTMQKRFAGMNPH
jgi:hypothetical protein